MAGLAQTARWPGSNGYGEFSLSPSGAWTFTSWPSAQATWQPGQRYTDSLCLTTLQGVVKTITVEMVALSSASGSSSLWEPRPQGDGLTMLGGSSVTAQLWGVPTDASGAVLAPTPAASGVGLSALTSTVHGSNGLTPRGVAITALDPRVLLWFSTNSGSTWQQVQAGDLVGQALLLQDDGATRVALAAASGMAPGESVPVQGLASALAFRGWSGVDAAGSTTANGLLVAAPTTTGAGTAYGSLQNSATMVVANGAVALSDVHLVADTGAPGDGITHNPNLTSPSLVAWGVSVAYRWQKDGGSWSGWSNSDNAPLADGTYAVQVRQSNGLGESATQTLAFVLDTQVAVATVAPVGAVRYVMVRNTNAFDAAEVQVMASVNGVSTNVALNKAVLVGPQGAWGGTTGSASYSASKLVDGGNNSTEGNAYASAVASSDAWVQIDLGGYYAVSRVVVVPRPTYNTTTINGAQVMLSATPMASTPTDALPLAAWLSLGQAAQVSGVTAAAETRTFSYATSAAVSPAPLLYGTGEAGAMVELFDTAAVVASSNPSGKIGSTTVMVGGTWRLQASSITSGSHTITTQQTDLAGNKSGTSSGYAFTVDASAMGLPMLDAGSDSGAQGDFITNMAQPMLQGLALSTGDGVKAVQVFDNGSLLGTATIDIGAKTWRLTPSSSLSAGVHNITVKDVTAGKTSGAWGLTIDTACTAPGINAVADTTSAPVVSGTGEAGATLVLTATPSDLTDGSVTQSFVTQVNASGTWRVDTGAVPGGQPLVAGKSYTLYASATDAAGNMAGLAAVAHVLYDQVMDAQLQSLSWRMDLGAKGQRDAGDVLRLSFDQAVGLTVGSLPTAVWGTGALLAAVEPTNGKSRVWDVKLGTGHTVGANGLTTVLTGVSDVLGNVGTVGVNLVSMAGLQGSAPATWRVTQADVEDEGAVMQGWATPGASLKLNWGGQLTNAFTADAQGYWSYTFYKNESYFGRKVPLANVDQPLALLQVNADASTTTLWQQTARYETTPAALAVMLAPGSALPLSKSLAVRAGRSVALDVRDATLDMPAGTSVGTWQVKVSGLAPYQTLNHGSRDSAGVWTVAAADWADLRINTTTNTVQEDRTLRLSYEQLQGSGGGSASWVAQRQASVALSVLPWVQIPAGTSTEDWAGFTQVQQAWNLGLKGLSGAGINIGDHEGSAININAASDFELGNVLAGSYSMTTTVHAHRVGQRAAGSIDGPFVGVAFGANIKWTDTTQGMDVTNWSVGYWPAHITGQWNDVDVTQRRGLGNVWVICSGNEGTDATAVMTTTKNPTGITVGSIDNASGERASFSNYGEGLWVVHPGGGGTSYAAPAVAGQVALLLEANPGLGTRDVKNILALSATYYTTVTPLKGFDLNHARVLNGAGAHFSNQIGLGVSNVFNAVRLAADWLADGSAAQVMVNWSRDSTPVATTPVTVSTVANTVTTVNVTVTDDVKLEALQVYNTINSDSFSKMRVVVTSPAGTVSELFNGSQATSFAGYLQMTSNKFFGESSKGTWTISYEFIADATSAATVSNVGLSLFGNLNNTADKYVYTDQFGLQAQLADAHTQAQMGWLWDLNGGNDSLMLSAMNTDVQVHLGRHGWMKSAAFKVLMSPGTQIENAFGGDGNDVLVGLANGKSILRGNEGSDVLMAYGFGSTLDGGNADDWLWLGGNTTATTTATGGQGNDRFMVFQGEGTLTNTAAVRARVSDFDTALDSLLSYDVAGNFKLAQFDSVGALTGWSAVTNSGVLQTLQGQLAQSDAPDVLGVSVSGSSTAPTVTVQFDQSPVHVAAGYAAWTINGVAPASAVLTGSSLSLSYSGVGSGAAGVGVLDTSGSQLYSTLGVKLPYQKLYVGSSGADTLDASGQAGAVAVFGQGGADVLVGGSGADLLVAQTGAQVRMTGGAGADVFRLQSAGTGSGGQNGVAAGRLEVTDFSLNQGDRLDLDALLQNIGTANFVEDCVQFTRINNDAVLAFDLSGQKAFGSSAFTVQLDNIYTSSALTDVTLRSLLYGTAMNSVLG